MEETGWTVHAVGQIGFIHFHHLAEKPEGYEYPYPDFIWPIYVAEATGYRADIIIPDDYVKNSRFIPIEDVKKLPLDVGQHALLDVALAMRQFACSIYTNPPKGMASSGSERLTGVCCRYL